VLAALRASASRSRSRRFEAPAATSLDPSTWPAALDEIQGLGVDSLRVVLLWRNVAPSSGSSRKPDFDTTDPAGYDWGQYDALLTEAKARGMRVLLTVSGPVPRWATEDKRDNLTRPRPAEFARFMTAVGRHFASRVSSWSVWNEPNQPQFLQPQYDSAKRPVSPRIYRALYKAALKGLRAAGVASPEVLIGETSPRGTGKVVAPLTFLRGALCLDANDRLQKGCGRLSVQGVAHHAYTTREGPRFIPSGPNDVTISVLSRLTRVVDRAGRAGAVPRNLPLHLTEFGIQSAPDPIFGVPLQRQEEYRALSERIAYQNPRVKTFSQYLLRDDDARPGGPPSTRYPASSRACGPRAARPSRPCRASGSSSARPAPAARRRCGGSSAPRPRRPPRAWNSARAARGSWKALRTVRPTVSGSSRSGRRLSPAASTACAGRGRPASSRGPRSASCASRAGVTSRGRGRGSVPGRWPASSGSCATAKPNRTARAPTTSVA
jgi:hypothetical protein